MRRRGELVERSFAHCLETGGMRRTRLRGRVNILKRYLAHVAAFNLGIVMRQTIGVGTPRGLAALRELVFGFMGLARDSAVRVADFLAGIGAVAAIILSDPDSR